MRSTLDFSCLLPMKLGLGLVLVQGWMIPGEPPVITGEFTARMCKQETKGSGRECSFVGSGFFPESLCSSGAGYWG